LNTTHEQPILKQEQKSVVRRLTPLECTRLQGFPDGWVDIGEWTDTKGKLHKDADAPKYKALGNSIALPFWEWLARRIVAQYEGPVTMGSLFDGISGFPLAFSRAGATPIWSSEVEEFCIAVAKTRFGED
jgi:Site-specific DNA methylase